ncbi:fimbrial protein [Enterobacter sp. DRP3]|nr:fimbrial protein [Enterobacter sp. DRP3]
MTKPLTTAKRVMRGLLIALFMTMHSVQALDNNLQIGGTLVSEPCTLDPVQNTLTVDFGPLIMKGLYKDTRSAVIPFTITLSDCDTTLAQSVVLTLNGEESLGLPGMLAATGTGGKGIAIGLETPEGVAVAINKEIPAYTLTDTTLIPLQAWVEAEPDAIKNQSLIAGEFSATATLDVRYP